MNNLKALVNYEHIETHRLTYPNSDRWTGITMGIRSSSSEAAKAVARKHLDDQLKLKGRQRKTTSKEVEANELESVASTIAWCTFEKGEPSDESKALMAKAREEGKSEEEIAALDDSETFDWNGSIPDKITMDIAMEMVEVPWIYRQVKLKGDDVENFMKGARKR